MQTEILEHAPRFVIQTVILIVPIWILLKVQKVKANFFLLFLLAALTSGLDMIPQYGHYVAGLVLLLCLFRFTKAKIASAALTAAFAYGALFAVNFYCMGTILDTVKDHLNVLARSKAPVSESVPQDMAMDSMTNGYVATNATPTVAKLPPEIAAEFALKGVSVNARNSTAMFRAGENTYTIGVNEMLLVDTTKGRMLVRCEGVSEHSALLNVDGKQLQLFLR
ncbi:MAG TPA: hypothetical protein VKA67_07865 [Verrucomicrobiae bacterium]|nr:hypothetical protein [Verrucomicrobiae bacterium]